MQVLWLDQADAQVVAEGEEVTLMDWGNAIIRVRQQHCFEICTDAHTCARTLLHARYNIACDLL